MTDWLGVLDAGSLDGTFLWLVGRDTSLLVTLVSLAVAVGVGAVHAVGPGHGKALIGAYLLGARARRRDAVALGGVVALMHTGSVLAVGLALYLTQRMAAAQPLESVLRLASACAVTVLGAVLLRGQLRRTRERRSTGGLPAAQRSLVLQGSGRPGHHDHGSQHSHHGHSHQLPEGVAPLSRAGLVALASSGGLLPSPSALLVLASAIAIGRTGFGLALVVAFSLGLATTLTSIGLTCVLGRRALQHRVHGSGPLRRVVEVLPVCGAGAVLLGGLLLAGSVLVQL